MNDKTLATERLIIPFMDLTSHKPNNRLKNDNYDYYETVEDIFTLKKMIDMQNNNLASYKRLYKNYNSYVKNNIDTLHRQDDLYLK